MANYVARHNKKRASRVWREAKLALSIERGDPRERQLRLADDVRLARMRQFRADRALIVPTDSNATMRLEHFDTKIAEIEFMTAEQILEEFVTR